MGIEFELKYQASESLLSQIRQQLSGPEQIFHMHTTYYDTPTGRFSEKKYTLRRRMENDVSVCTLKPPDTGHGRREWEVRCGTIEEGISELCKLGGPADILSLADEGLIPICGARFTRIAKTVFYDGARLELALDSGVLTGGTRQQPLCEVEVELKSGTEEACVAFASQLAARFGLVPEKSSKFRRALALYKGA